MPILAESAIETLAFPAGQAFGDQGMEINSGPDYSTCLETTIDVNVSLYRVKDSIGFAAFCFGASLAALFQPLGLILNADTKTYDRGGNGRLVELRIAAAATEITTMCLCRPEHRAFQDFSANLSNPLRLELDL